MSAFGTSLDHDMSFERGNSNFHYISPPRQFDEKKYRKAPVYERNYDARMKREREKHHDPYDFNSTVPYYLRKKNRIKIHEVVIQSERERGPGHPQVYSIMQPPLPLFSIW